MKPNKILTIFAAPLVGLAMMGQANAGTIEHTYTNTVGLNSVANIFNISLFDTALGTLTDVKYKLSDAFAFTNDAANLTGQTQTYTITMTNIDTFAGIPGVAGTYALTTPGYGTYTQAAFTYYQWYYVNTNSIDFIQTSGLTSWESIVGIAQTQQVTATRTQTTTYNNSNISNYPQGPQYNITGLPQTVTLRVIYDYTPASVPEPSYIALLATGLIGFGASRKKATQA